MKSPAWLFVIVGTLGGVGLGYVLRGEPPAPEGVGRARVERLHQEVSMLREQLAEQGVEPLALPDDGAPADDPADGEVQSDAALRRATERLIVALMGIEEGEEEDQLRAYTQQKLLEELARNPEALRFALDELAQTAGSEKAAELAVVLGLLPDPEVEARALALARTGNRDQRLLGLELLDRLNIENPETRAGVVEILRNEQDNEVLGAAVYALHPGVSSPADAREVRAVLSPLTGASDAELRRRSVIALAEWAHEAGDLDTVLTGLRDPSPDVRAGAAFALSQTVVWTPASRAALAARVGDPDEDWTVREQAWYSLAPLPQDQASYEAYQAFRELRDGLGEGFHEDVHEGDHGDH